MHIFFIHKQIVVIRPFSFEDFTIVCTDDDFWPQIINMVISTQSKEAKLRNLKAIVVLYSILV